MPIRSGGASYLPGAAPPLPPPEYDEPIPAPPGPAAPGMAWTQYWDAGNGQYAWEQVRLPESEGEAGAAASRYGSELTYQLGLAQLAEAARANRASEASAARQRALDAASNALQAYTTGTQLADQRRLAAAQESRELLPYLVSPSQKYQAGLEPAGPLAVMASRYGLPFTPQEVPQKQLRPSELATPPPEGAMGAGILQGIQQVRGMGNA